VDPRTDRSWHVLARSDQGSLFTSPRWIDAVCSTYQFSPEARVVLNADGLPTDGFSWVRVDDLRGARIVSMPFSDRAEPFAADDRSWRLLSEDAFQDDLPLTLRCFEGSAATGDPRLAVVGAAVWHGTTLDLRPEVMRAAIKPSARRNIATAQRAGVIVSASGGFEALETYHRLHVRLRKYKYGLLAQPLALFEEIWKAFAVDDSIVTLLAHVDGTPVAGAVYLVWNDALYYKFGASLADYLPLRPNDALHWHAMAWGAARGLTSFDWGLSDIDQPGLVAYKRKWASHERRIVTLRRLGGKPDAHADEVSALLGGLVGVLTDHGVPDEITASAGGLLYRYFC
jgi:CelD/BcsL family acetyltransferase involved in cellulose biosynthesis